MFRTFSSDKVYDTTCLLMTCKVTAADDSTTFLQLSLGLRVLASCIADILHLVWHQAFTAQRRQDSTDVVPFCFAAAITDQYIPHQPVPRQASDRCLRPRRVVDAELSMRSQASRVMQTDVLLLSAPNTRCP